MDKTYVITKPVSLTDASNTIGCSKKSIIVTVQENTQHGKNTAEKIIKFRLAVKGIWENPIQLKSLKFEGLCVTRRCRFIGYFYNNRRRNKKEHGRLVLFPMRSAPPPSSAPPLYMDNGR